MDVHKFRKRQKVIYNAHMKNNLCFISSTEYRIGIWESEGPRPSINDYLNTVRMEYFYIIGLQ